MEYINVFGLVFMVVIMVPNIIFALRNKDSFENIYHNKALETAEEIGRYGCFVFMIFRIPSLTFGWWSDEAFAIYLVVDVILILLYCLIWALCFRKESLFRSLSLSVIPSIVFIFSGIMMRSIPLILFSLLFAPSHITISVKNVKAR